MSFSLNTYDFLSVENPSTLENFHEIFELFSYDLLNNENTIILKNFVTESFLKSILKLKSQHVIILLRFIKKNKSLFNEIDYTPTYFSHLVRQIITNDQEPDNHFTKIIAELFNPDRFFYSHYHFYNSLNDISAYLESAAINNDKKLLQAFFSYKYTIDYFYDYKKDFLISLNNQISIQAVKLKLVSHNF
tara:strand:- start:4898 stop:5467 length:570 start_codon:yes stop_codon:yes gene_type:complete